MSHSSNRHSLFRTAPTKWHRWKPMLYVDVQGKLEWFQVAGVIIAVIYLTSCPKFRALVTSKDLSFTTTFILSELIATFFIGNLVGWNRIPVNYISLSLIWFLIFYSPVEVTLVTWSAWIPLAKKHSFSIAAAITICCFISSRSKLRMGQSGIGILVTNTFGTSFSALILLMSILVKIDEERSRQLTSLHFRLTILWAYVTTAITFCNLGFLLRTFLVVLMKRQRGSDSLMKKTLLETLIWAMTAAISVPCIAALHPQLTLDDVFSWTSAQAISDYLLFLPFPGFEMRVPEEEGE